ncbi:hypothetical protein [Natronobiforma cellulositropha]|uniref:hypothetical protein n=1 Tax=Natronobiforma cellulositropha TaxID=1679076 RepID=UPI0021D5D8EA|nr:hypothetical protein [Natronobiforma cellulositropha]
MKASIEGEDSEGCGLEVIDNNGTEHWIEIKYESGDISYHEQDGYADDPDQRTEDDNERVNQARRFAKFHVYRERGFDTLEHVENPDYVDAVRRAMLALSDEAFERYFGPLRQQLRSHHEDVERPVALPAGVRAPNAVVYKLDIYLGVDIEGSGLTDQARTLAEAHDLEYDDGTQPRSGEAVTDADRENWAAVGEQLVERADGEDLELEVAAVSGIHVGFPNARGEHEVQWADSPLDREPDARLELLPAEPGTLAEFREYLDHHLRCQIRDCFVGMGLVPPDPYKVVGFGKFIYARRYDHYDLYPQLHKRDGDHGTFVG